MNEVKSFGENLEIVHSALKGTISTVIGVGKVLLSTMNHWK